METGRPNQDAPNAHRPGRLRKLFRGCAFGCGGLLICFAILIGAGLLLLSKVPKTYPGVKEPIAPPPPNRDQGGGLAGFDSPYLGHTGSWDGKGGAMMGRSKVPDLEVEKGMGLKWTFMPVYWKAMEPDGPVDLTGSTPAQWLELDGFVIAAKARGLNILMQAPVVGGNGGGPPDWAGRREEGKSAPANMDAAAEFAGKLARRYCPGGTLSKEQGWNNDYGVRAWELDNEPESYRTHWKDQAGDYAEFATKCAAAIRAADPEAVILLPAVAGGPGAIPWVEATLNAGTLSGSPQFQAAGKHYSIGKIADAVSFHCYEGLETGFAREDRTLERDFSEIRAAFEKWENRVPGFEYARKQDYWHTEGNFDFLGILSAERRAAWRFQFLTRGFAAGIRKLMIMDASTPEQNAVRAYIRVLHNPFPMVAADDEVSVLRGRAVAFKHADGPEDSAGRVWVVWAAADSGDATVQIPAVRPEVWCVGTDGVSTPLKATEGKVRIELKGDKKMAPGVLVVDRLNWRM